MLKGPKKILVINLRNIGDTIWMYPFLRNLKLNSPHSEITVLVNEGGEIFLKLSEDVSEVIPLRRREIKGRLGLIEFVRFLMEIRRRKFDVVFALTSCDRPLIIGFISGAGERIGFKPDSWWSGALLSRRVRWNDASNPHMIDDYLRTLTDVGLKIFDTSLTMDVPQDAINGIRERFTILKERGKKTLIVHPGARIELRQWGSDRFAEVINSIAGDYRVFLVGGPGDSGEVRDVLKRLKKTPDIVSNDLSLLEFAALCKLSDLFVGNDSAPIHIAAAVGTFVIGIYGPNLSRYCAPWTDRKALFDFSSLPCRPCKQDRCKNEKEKACLKEVTPAMVIEKIGEVMKDEFPS